MLILIRSWRAFRLFRLLCEDAWISQKKIGGHSVRFAFPANTPGSLNNKMAGIPLASLSSRSYEYDDDDELALASLYLLVPITVH